MKNSNIRGYLEIDYDRGVIYFHAEEASDQVAFGGPTILRICGLPNPVPRQCLDVSHMFGQNWGDSLERKDSSELSSLEDIIIEELIDSDFKPGVHEAYAYIMDCLFKEASGRVVSHFSKILGSLNWKRIERIVKEVVHVAPR